MKWCLWVVCMYPLWFFKVLKWVSWKLLGCSPSWDIFSFIHSGIKIYDKNGVPLCGDKQNIIFNVVNPAISDPSTHAFRVILHHPKYLWWYAVSIPNHTPTFWKVYQLHCWIYRLSHPLHPLSPPMPSNAPVSRTDQYGSMQDASVRLAAAQVGVHRGSYGKC